jgi:hypothetical protein
MPSATIKWPALLNSKPRPGLGVQLGTTAMATEFEQGASRKRQRFAAAIDEVEQELVLKQFNGQIDEVAIFLHFFKHTTKGGTLWFEVSIYTGNGGYQLFDARFKDVTPPKPTNASNAHYTVQFTLEVVNYMTLDAATGWFVGEYGEPFTLSFTDELDRLVNEELQFSLGGLS